MYYYQEGHCITSKYFRVNAVVYEKTSNDEDALYQKTKMGCHLKEDGTCQLPDMECPVFKAAPENIEKNKEWQLRTKKL